MALAQSLVVRMVTKIAVRAALTAALAEASRAAALAISLLVESSPPQARNSTTAFARALAAVPVRETRHTTATKVARRPVPNQNASAAPVSLLRLQRA